ncbi:peptidase [Coprinopsis cinerea okayama7|uniref:Peptidase n=1 Tax=Coprinopsis cinerea (strain Okayama-7 / 130 / ATCC MYA-4618 / FGSC 9003) TaxID=240176 RepID=A8N7M8_COPC7|nr:peptidase [Coprinopsis cinerea okayama7\|eukprot:XP_001830834.2 peptidase [Coprinopsis cinerea okayama7\
MLQLADASLLPLGLGVVRIDPPRPEFNYVPSGEVPRKGSTPAAHRLAGVDKLHGEGITGKGVKVAVHSFSIGSELISRPGTNEMKPDDDPMDECNGHGSHVAGIIAASGENNWNVTGVAPDATLYAYRVFGCLGFVTDTLIIQAMLRAVKDGVDVINISIGGRDGWTRATGSVVASRIAATGKVVVISAGNEGMSGAFYTSGPANGIDVISVGSVENTILPLQTVNVVGAEHDPIPYFSWLPFNVTEDLPLYATSNDTTVEDDACEELPEDTPLLDKYLVLVRRGSCPFTQKIENLRKKNATQALFYDNGSNFLGIVVGNFTGALIKAEDGEWLVEQFLSGADVKLNFPQTGGEIDHPAVGGGLMSNFSSYGPTNDFYFKPALAAPGGNILSTVPLNMSAFAVVSGTSMSAPFVAGSAALILSVRGVTPEVGRATRNLLETTASYVPSSDAEDALLQTAIQQGAGLVNVHKAVHTTTLVSPGELVLNDTANFKPVHKVLLNNTGDTERTYSVKHVPAGTALTILQGVPFQSNGPVPLVPEAASVEASPSTFTLAPGEGIEVTLTFTQPEGLDLKRFPIYSGFVEFEDDTEETTHVSYIGSAVALKDVQVVDNTPLYFGEKMPMLTNSSGMVQHEPTNYTFVGNDTTTIYWRQLFGTRLFLLDVVDANISLRTTLNRRQAASSDDAHIFTFPSEDQSNVFTEVKVTGNLVTLDYLPRNNDNPYDYGYNALAWVQPKFANGTRVPPGDYRLLLRALKVTGDPSKDEDYESWLSPVVGVYPTEQEEPEEPETPEPEDPEDPENPEDPETPEPEEPEEPGAPEPEDPEAPEAPEEPEDPETPEEPLPQPALVSRSIDLNFVPT